MTKEGDKIKKGKDAIDIVLKEIESGELDLGLQKNIWELSGTDTSCRFENWKQYVRNFKDKLIHAQQNDIMLGALEFCWDDAKYHDYKREEYYDFGESPLEILSYCMGDLLTYPPPEILDAIASQFCYYMAMEGKVSFEEAFFGKPKGRGIYAKRIAEENHFYKRFNIILDNRRDKNQSQIEVLEQLSVAQYLILPGFPVKAPNPFYKLEETTDLDSFLRGFRRWKKRHEK